MLSKLVLNASNGSVVITEYDVLLHAESLTYRTGAFTWHGKSYSAMCAYVRDAGYYIPNTGSTNFDLRIEGEHYVLDSDGVIPDDKLMHGKPARQCWCGCVAGKPWMGLA